LNNSPSMKLKAPANIKQEAHRTAKASCMLTAAAATDKPLASQFATKADHGKGDVDFSRENIASSGVFRGIRVNTQGSLTDGLDLDGAERVGKAVARIQSAIVLGEKDKAFLESLFSEMSTTAGTTTEPSTNCSLTPSAMNSKGNLIDDKKDTVETASVQSNDSEQKRKQVEFEKKKEVHTMKKAALKRFKQLMRRGNASEPMAGAVAIAREPINKLNLVTKSPRSQSGGAKQRHVWTRPSFTEVLPMFNSDTESNASRHSGSRSTMCSIM